MGLYVWFSKGFMVRLPLERGTKIAALKKIHTMLGMPIRVRKYLVSSFICRSYFIPDGGAVIFVARGNLRPCSVL